MYGRSSEALYRLSLSGLGGNLGMFRVELVLEALLVDMLGLYWGNTGGYYIELLFRFWGLGFRIRRTSIIRDSNGYIRVLLYSLLYHYYRVGGVLLMY